ncbi:MAG: glycerate kinase [Planctomycetaceae bacterium]
MTLREQARAIWEAGVAAVASDRLVRNAVSCDGHTLSVRGESFAVDSLARIVVLGTGKAGAGMASAIEAALGDELTDAKVTGWVNVPADCVRPLRRITLHAARPAGVNEPTETGVFGTQRILELAHGAGSNDVVLVLISGGGSALSPAPIPEITLADKQAVTRFLMRSGASIQELNTVRKHLSLFKGGGLARAAAQVRAVITLIISDVIGDPLDVIASGPTVEDTSTSADALAVLDRFGAHPPQVPESIFTALRCDSLSRGSFEGNGAIQNHVIGNNATALEAAASKAQELGFTVQSLGSNNAGEAQAIGRDLAELCLRIRDGQADGSSPICVLSGGEPIVKLVPTNQPRKGGRNQELALAALRHLWSHGLDRIAILSGGTDGEDGPTNAAGAVIDESLRQSAITQALDPAEFLAINNSYPFFEQTGGLLLTGPTHTNVMDLRVAVVRRSVESRND